MRKKERGIELLDIAIIILVVAVVVAILTPKFREQKKMRITERCRQEIKALSEAEFRFYKENWRKSFISPDSLAKLDSIAAVYRKKGRKPPFQIPDTTKVEHIFTDDINKLKEYLPSWAETLNVDGKCPLDGRDYIIVVRDSTFFSISCPNLHGESVKGIYSWEKK